MSQEIIEQESSQLAVTSGELICSERSQAIPSRKQNEEVIGTAALAWQAFLDSRALRIVVTICVAFLSRYWIQFFLQKSIPIGEHRAEMLEAIAGNWCIPFTVVVGTIVYRFGLTQLHLVYVRSELERRPKHEESSIQGNIALSGLLAYLFFVYCESTWVSMGALVVFAAIYSILRFLDEPAMLRSHICLLYTSDAADE